MGSRFDADNTTVELDERRLKIDEKAMNRSQDVFFKKKSCWKERVRYS